MVNLQRVLLASIFVCLLNVPILQAQQNAAISSARSQIDDAVLRNVELRPDQWISHGRDLAETRFSPLDQIQAGNVDKLGLAWSYDTGTSRGLEATPLIVDGVMYSTGTWSMVYAIDARTGKEIWKYDPKVDRKYGARACCDVVNRGVAIYQGKVYVGVLDGRLVALDKVSGKPVWEVMTVDQSRPYTITAAPRVADGKIIIGNGGGEFGVRGYVSAYYAQSGELAWRFYTVPGNPADPFESPAMEKAAKTWTGKWWEIGGGGTVWDSVAYDPELKLVYAGVGNGSPWNPHLRGDGKSDNLYLSSIVALNVDTGKLAWHYQTTPGDAWDYTATQHMILTDLTIDGRDRKVLMQAPKNGFFYVLDRKTGELLSAEPYIKINWASGIDKATGRPIEAPGMRYKHEGKLVIPGALGGHNWQPMSYSPQTGLVYIPAQDNSMFYSQQKDFVYRPGTWNTGVDFAAQGDTAVDPPSGFLLAWDPVKQQARWRVQHEMMWNGGTLVTAGDLVFQGLAEGRFAAYNASTGKQLWDVNLGSGIIATPVTYRIDGVQYVSIMAGWGGAGAMMGGIPSTAPGRLLTFALSGTEQLAAVTQETSVADVTHIETNGDETAAERGAIQYARSCAVCHGFAGIGSGVITDLRLSDGAMFDEYEGIVLDGDMTDSGMPSFGQWLSKEDVADIRHYIATLRNGLVSD